MSRTMRLWLSGAAVLSSLVPAPLRSGPVTDLLKTAKGTQQVFEMVCREEVSEDAVPGCIFLLQLLCGQEKTARDRARCLLRVFNP